MPKTTWLLLLLCLSNHAFAQDLDDKKPSKRNEVGLSFSNLNSFGVVYRFGRDKALWRVSSANTFVRRFESKSVDAVSNSETISFGIRLGREFRTNIDQKNQFRWGVDFSYGYRKDQNKFRSFNTGNLDRITRNITNEVGIHAVIGMNFPIGNRLLLGVELLPSFTYEFGSEFEDRVNPTFTNDFEISRSNFSLSNDGAILVFTYTL